ncbi:MAG: phospholipase [Alphaproteobacteria bacterium]|nr:phospholipase [Alphaproteobacteria bacterium]
MSQGKITNFYEHLPASGKEPRHLILLLHGLGSNGRDLMSLVPAWADKLPEAVVISPDAPFNCDMAPFGYQWFSLREWTPESILRGVESAAPILENFITEQRARFNIPAAKTALVGFSQGTMMSLYEGSRYPEKLAGILGYSGALVGEEGLIQDPDEFRKPPIHLIHGDADTVVPVTAWHHAMEILKKAGLTVSGHTTPGLMHGIDPQGMNSGLAFLKAVLGA